MEVWKDIPGFEGLYQASSTGCIRTHKDKTTSSKKFKERHWKQRVLKTRGKQNSGYRVSLWKDGVVYDRLVARLVATTFLGEPPEGFTVNHKDGNRFNNNIENLEWLSREDNIRHGFRNGLYPTTKVFIENDEESYEFISMAECDRFLGRYIGYTSECAKKEQTLKATNGNKYNCHPIF